MACRLDYAIKGKFLNCFHHESCRLSLLLGEGNATAVSVSVLMVAMSRFLNLALFAVAMPRVSVVGMTVLMFVAVFRMSVCSIIMVVVVTMTRMVVVRMVMLRMVVVMCLVNLMSMIMLRVVVVVPLSSAGSEQCRCTQTDERFEVDIHYYFIPLEFIRLQRYGNILATGLQKMKNIVHPKH